MYEWNKAILVYMSCMCNAGTRDLHGFLNVAWQTADERKKRKMGMKSDIVL